MCIRDSPQPALSSLATRADVLTLGTFSTLLSRELAAGYVVASPATAEVLREVRSVLGMPVSSVTQRAIAYLLNDGVARRSSRAVHRGLAKRREVLNERLVPLVNGAELAPGDGADLAVHFDTRKERDAFEQRLLEAGVESGHESALWTNGGDGLLLSFAHLSASDFDHAVEIVVQTVGRI